MGCFSSKEVRPQVIESSPEDVHRWQHLVYPAAQDPLRVATLCLNVLAWHHGDHECFVTWDALEDVMPFLYREPSWTFRDSDSKTLVPGDPTKDDSYTTDISKESVEAGHREVIAVQFNVKDCSHDLCIVQSTYNTSVRLYKTLSLGTRIRQSGVYVVCICAQHRQMVVYLMKDSQSQTKFTEYPPKMGALDRPCAPIHVAVSLYGTYASAEFRHVPPYFEEPPHDPEQCWI